MAKKIKNDCLTKTDVQKFFNDLGTVLFVAFVTFMTFTGITVTGAYVIDWMEKPSKVEILSDKVDYLQQEIRDNRRDQSDHIHTFYGNDPVVYYTIHSHDATH